MLLFDDHRQCQGSGESYPTPSHGLPNTPFTSLVIVQCILQRLAHALQGLAGGPKLIGKGGAKIDICPGSVMASGATNGILAQKNLRPEYDVA